MAPWLLYCFLLIDRLRLVITTPHHNSHHHTRTGALLTLLLLHRLIYLVKEQESREREMASVWKNKVLPSLTKIFDKDGKKAAALDFLKSFNKEEIGKEIEDKKTELEPKVVQAYEASPPEVKALFKDKKPAKITKKNSAAVTKFLDELAKIEFPGAKLVSDAVAKSGTTPLAPAITFLLDKVAPFIPAPKEEPKAEPEPAAAAEAASREVAVEEKKEEAEPAAAAATEEAAPAETSEAVEEKKEEEKPAEAAAEAAAEAPPAEEKK